MGSLNLKDYSVGEKPMQGSEVPPGRIFNEILIKIIRILLANERFGPFLPLTGPEICTTLSGSPPGMFQVWDG
jgi:hypothetical protein